jgi:hypothetical protein
MTAKHLLPGLLEADATVPQCLDNQFIPNDVFPDLGAAGFADPGIAQRLDRAAKTEFIRSLVYSAQVVVNRAFFVNNARLYQYYLPGGPSLGAFASLLQPTPGRSQVIVPYLMTELSLAQPAAAYGEDPQGRAALDALMQHLGTDVTCVRLAPFDHAAAAARQQAAAAAPEPDAEKRKATEAAIRKETDAANLRRVAQLTMKFGSYLSGQLNQITMPSNALLLNEMAAELFGSRAHCLAEEGALDVFRRQLKEIARFAADEDGVSRTKVYQKFFAAGTNEKETKDNVVRGVFRRASSDQPFLFEAKKLVDLVYNTNLPDVLQRYTFTPVGMPSRIALQDFSAGETLNTRQEAEGVIDASAARKQDINRIFMSNVQRGMYLPLLADLQMDDVVQIRALPAWAEFAAAQQAVLKDPLQVVELLDTFISKFDAFQRQLSEWYLRTAHGERLREKAKRYANFATVALQVAGKILIKLGFPGVDPASAVRTAALETTVEQAGQFDRVKGFMINLMVYVVDVTDPQKLAIDNDRSYSLELMRSEAEYTYEEVCDLFRRFSSDLYGRVDDAGDAQLAAQGK